MSLTTRGGGDWRDDTLPTTICGASGAGKTTLARYLQFNADGPSILFDLDHELEMGVVVESVEELAQALARGEEQIAVRPPATTVREPELFPEVVQYLIRFGNELRRAGHGRMNFLMDEAQDLQTDWVAVAMKRLRKRRIKPVAMTQDPVSLDKRIRTQADYNLWLSPPPADMYDFLKQSRYPLELLKELEQYDALVLGEGWEPIARVRAPEKYATA